MIIFPAIDICEGSCVRLFQGDYSQKKVYYKNPIDAAYYWEDQGATHLHIVDLDGAKQGQLIHFSVIEDIANKTNLILELGGGIRTTDDIERCLNAGIMYAVLGTKAISEKKFIEKAFHLFPENIVVGIDSRNGYVATNGWLQTSVIKAVDLAQKMDSLGVKRMICTDIATDGALKGTNIEYILDLIKATKNIALTASGGISTRQDVKNICSIPEERIDGMIIGKALYDKCFTLSEVLSLC